MSAQDALYIRCWARGPCVRTYLVNLTDYGRPISLILVPSPDPASLKKVTYLPSRSHPTPREGGRGGLGAAASTNIRMHSMMQSWRRASVGNCVRTQVSRRVSQYVPTYMRTRMTVYKFRHLSCAERTQVAIIARSHPLAREGGRACWLQCLRNYVLCTGQVAGFPGHRGRRRHAQEEDAEEFRKQLRVRGDRGVGRQAGRGPGRRSAFLGRGHVGLNPGHYQVLACDNFIFSC